MVEVAIIVCDVAMTELVQGCIQLTALTLCCFVGAEIVATTNNNLNNYHFLSEGCHVACMAIMLSFDDVHFLYFKTKLLLNRHDCLGE